MIEDMIMRKLSTQTQTAYIRVVKNLAGFLGQSPDAANAEDLRRYQLHLVEQGVSSGNLNATITGLKFFFGTTLERPEIMKRMRHVYEPRKLPIILSLEEVTRLLQSAGGLKYQAALGVAYGAGLRANEVAHLSVGDIDSERMVIRVEQGKGKRDRRANGIATRCSHLPCSNCYAPGGDMPAHNERCCPVAGCFRDKTP
jgi:site-specific recombinase XerD